MDTTADFMQHPHHHSLGNVMRSKLPGIRFKGLFYGMQNIIFHTGIPATSESTSVCHSE
jgi:hypothetical protein